MVNKTRCQLAWRVALRAGSSRTIGQTCHVGSFDIRAFTVDGAIGVGEALGQVGGGMWGNRECTDNGGGGGEAGQQTHGVDSPFGVGNAAPLRL